MAAYETYETDATYDDMERNPTTERAPEAVPQPVKIEIKSGNTKFKFVQLAILLLILLAIGGVIGILLMTKLEESGSDDCDIGPWGPWTSCYLPPDRCGIGSRNRTRDKLADAQNKGEKCAKSRIIELAETLSCEVDCKTPVDCKVGSWGSWTGCSVTCGGGTKERTREKLADALNNGTECVSSRSLRIPLTETNTCNDEDCPWTGPEQCSNYNMLNSSSRNHENRGRKDCNNGGNPCCDTKGRSYTTPDWKGPGWYRIGGQAGTKLVEKGTGVSYSCGTIWGGWLEGGHPTPEEGEVSRTVHFNSNSNDRERSTSIKVINCNRNYFVYYLPKTVDCYDGYCTQ